MQVYRWQYSASFLIGLHAIYKLDAAGKVPAEGVKKNDLCLTNNNWSRFYFSKYWSLIEEVSPAHWVITQKGRDFIEGNAAIPKYVWIYRGESIPKPDDDLAIQSAVTVDMINPELVDKERAIEDSTPFKSPEAFTQSSFFQ
jgi:hypothetical protein